MICLCIIVKQHGGGILSDMKIVAEYSILVNFQLVAVKTTASAEEKKRPVEGQIDWVLLGSRVVGRRIFFLFCKISRDQD